MKVTGEAAYRPRSGLTLHVMADGSAVLPAPGREAHALNADAAALWAACASWSVEAVAGRLRDSGYPPIEAGQRAEAFVEQLVDLGLLVALRD